MCSATAGRGDWRDRAIAVTTQLFELVAGNRSMADDEPMF
jgi:hypothetical protein